MSPTLSVVICTHNPRQDYLEKTLNALRNQTLLVEKWELLLVDNASKELLSLKISLDWHSQARHIREEQLGLTPARLRGIGEAQGEILIFVDDDNVLDPDYLEIALQIGKDYPNIAAWGGQIIPAFEESPPTWTKPYWSMLAVYEFDKDHWSNLPYNDTNPCGAGMCLRRAVAEKYAHQTQNDSRRLNLGRKGTTLVSCEDTDIAFTACDMGFGIGRFTALKLTHLLSANRLQENYLVRLSESNGYSLTMLRHLRGELELPKPSLKSQLAENIRLLLMDARDRRMYKARKKGEALAMKEILTTP
jgi:glycosyltransferase involved in cell wall biosynthesis